VPVSSLILTRMKTGKSRERIKVSPPWRARGLSLHAKLSKIDNVEASPGSDGLSGPHDAGPSSACGSPCVDLKDRFDFD
jgi:hypothetical protein